MTELIIQVTVNTDDGQEFNNTTWEVNGKDSDGSRVGDVAGDFDFGMRFPSATIPIGATIDSAVVELFMKFTDGSDIITAFKGFDEDNTATFGTGARPSQRPKTTAIVNRTYTDAGDWVDETFLALDDCTAVVQEIIDRGGWSSGNALGFVLENNGSVSSSRWQFQDFTNEPSNAAKITINYTEAASGLTLDSAPTTMAKAETGVSFQVSTPATVPTTGNTTVINSGDALTVTSVTGSDPYTINCTVPVDITKQAGSYAWTITVDAENVVSASIPLTVQAGWTNIVLATPLTTIGYMLNGFTGDTPVTGDTMEFETTTDLNPGLDSEWIWDTAPTVDQVVGRRVIQVDGTVGATADVTFLVAIGDIPIITLSGDNPETVEAGTSWSEAGYTATDTEDGTITGSVVVAGDTVDPNTLGSYSITYDVTDSDSNPATQVVRVVNVTDTIKPSVSLIGAAVKEVLLNGTYVELGATANDSFEGDLTGSIVIAGDTVDETTLGTYVLTYDVSDSSANAADQKTRTVNVVAELSTIPAANRTSINKIADALRALETYTHTQTNELVFEWLESEGISRSSLNGMLYGYLGGLGYTGSIDDRMKQWREAG